MDTTMRIRTILTPDNAERCILSPPLSTDRIPLLTNPIHGRDHPARSPAIQNDAYPVGSLHRPLHNDLAHSPITDHRGDGAGNFRIANGAQVNAYLRSIMETIANLVQTCLREGGPDRMYRHRILALVGELIIR